MSRLLPSSPLDVAAARRRFPALARTVAGRPVVYLDGPGGSQVPTSVIEAMTTYLRDSNANTGGAFVTSQETEDVIDAARAAAADLIGATPAEIAFGPSMTALNFALAHAVARTLEPGDEIVVTELDHDANVAPWLLVAADHGLVVRHAPLHPADGTLDHDALEALLGERTRIVAFTLASNALGTMPDARRIVEAAHAVGALAWADAVHYAPHARLDRDALELDIVLCSPYKFFGPHAGIAAIRRDLAETWPADRVRPAGQVPPGHRFEQGTLSHEALAGIVATVAYLEDLGQGDSRPARLDDAFARITAHERELSLRALERLAAIPACALHGLVDPARVDERTPTFCLTVDHLPPRALAEALGRDGIFTWDGNYYALAAMEALGLEGRGGALRAGFLHYTTLDEVDRFCDALESLAVDVGV
jgi:cysteine desulfurase family protein (TIGR01976 family)